MATQVLNHVKCLVGKYDLTGWMNAAALNYSADALDVTVFCNDTRIRKGGLKTVTAQLEGFFEAGTLGPDKAIDDYLALANVPLILIPGGSSTEASNVGKFAYGFLSNWAEYVPGGSVGEMLKFTMRSEATGPLVRGQILGFGSHSEIVQTSGSVWQVGAIGSTKTMYAALLVFSASGGTLDVIVESDDNAGFTSGNTRITFTQKTAAGYQWTSLAGPITDDYWRTSWTIGGGGTFSFAVFVGIL